ncbi:uncharacterized protein LOC116341609 isoform X2 [Contarinia nasturtii]|uniref:uncharacterized protein LOC116341609 isoform X2 n=1 Tax=Contarinia nasturtii TaxID=265458 RepID=UPI0012D4A256|nr:uncharacterized protein LOC116341609 isoform X2 [Contarinia nasturtii]
MSSVQDPNKHIHNNVGGSGSASDSGDSGSKTPQSKNDSLPSIKSFDENTAFNTSNEVMASGTGSPTIPERPLEQILDIAKKSKENMMGISKHLNTMSKALNSMAVALNSINESNIGIQALMNSMIDNQQSLITKLEPLVADEPSNRYEKKHKNNSDSLLIKCLKKNSK